MELSNSRRLWEHMRWEDWFWLESLKQLFKRAIIKYPLWRKLKDKPLIKWNHVAKKNEIDYPSCEISMQLWLVLSTQKMLNNCWINKRTYKEHIKWVSPVQNSYKFIMNPFSHASEQNFANVISWSKCVPFFKFLFNFQLTYTVTLVSGVEYSDSSLTFNSQCSS